MKYSEWNGKCIWEIGEQDAKKSYMDHYFYKDAQGHEIMQFNADGEFADYLYNGVAFGEGDRLNIYKIRVYDEFMDKEVM